MTDFDDGDMTDEVDSDVLEWRRLIEDSAAIMDIQNILDKFAKKLETVSTEDLQAQLLSYPVSNSEMAALDYLDKSNAKGG